MIVLMLVRAWRQQWQRHGAVMLGVDQPRGHEGAAQVPLHACEDVCELVVDFIGAGPVARNSGHAACATDIHTWTVSVISG